MPLKDKDARKRYNQEYAKKNSERISARRKAYREKNKERINQTNREYYKKHPEELKKYQVDYRKKHPEKIKEQYERTREHRAKYAKDYRIKNREKFKEYDRQYAEEHKEHKHTVQAEWRKKHMTHIKQYASKNHTQLRVEALKRICEFRGMGLVCNNGCGCSNANILQINHIAPTWIGKGPRPSEEIGKNLYRRIIKGMVDLDGFNVLCPVCNWAYHFEKKFGVKYKIEFLGLIER